MCKDNIHLIITCIICALLLAACGGTKTPATPTANMAASPSGRIAAEAQLNFDLARVLWKDTDTCSDPEKAISYLNKAIAIAPDYAEAYLRRGLAKSDLKEWDNAFDDLSRAVRLHPTPDAYAYRGLISMRSGNSLGARKDFNRSLELNSAQHRAWNYRAGLNLLENDNDAACQDFKKGCSNGDCTGLESAQKNGICK